MQRLVCVFQGNTHGTELRNYRETVAAMSQNRKDGGQRKRFEDALRGVEVAIRKLFIEAFTKNIAAINERALIEALKAGDILKAAEIVRMTSAQMFVLQEAVRSGFILGGGMISTDLPRAIRGRWGFNGRHLRAEQWIQRNGVDLIGGITEDTDRVVRKAITEGLQEGRSHQRIARDITGRRVGNKRVDGFLGLSSDQTDHVLRARQMLSDPNQIRNYFTRDRATGKLKPRYRLSDRRYDRLVQRAISEGRALKPAELDKVMEAHRAKALGYRGKVIAKDQAHSALAAGREEGYLQVLENPEVETVTVRWQHNRSLEPREDHAAMNGTIIQLGEAFDFPDGTQMTRPHDPVGGAKHSVGCRCTGIYRVRLRRD